MKKNIILKEIFNDLYDGYDQETHQGEFDQKEDQFLYGAAPLEKDPMYDMDNSYEEQEVPNSWETAYDAVLNWATKSGVRATEQDIINASDYWDVGVEDLTPGAIQKSMNASPKEKFNKMQVRGQRRKRWEDGYRTRPRNRNDVRIDNEEELREAPIRDLEPIGSPMDKPGGGFSPQDRKLLSNPKAIEKIRRQWENTPYTFDIYLLKVPQLNKGQWRQIGEVDNSSSFGKEFKDIVGQPLPNDGGAITILFNGNYGTDKVPMTGWVMAHRFGHAIRELPSWSEYVSEMSLLTKRILEEVYNKTLNLFKRRYRGKEETFFELKDQKMAALIFNQLGTFKSAREGKITRFYEFFYEVFAQYLLTGSIKFNPLTPSIVIGNLPFGRKQMARAVDNELIEMWNRDLEIYAGEIESRIENVLMDCIGKTFLM